ncbi:DUF4349 domain-containing protein, partial [Mycobacterium sp. ITM-2017-0098]
QREALGDQIAYSTVDLSFYAERVGGPAPKEYEGFLGQIQRGWDALVTVTGSAVLLLGLMLPWLAVLAVAGGVIYVLVRWAQRRAEPVPAAAPPPGGEPSEEDQPGG